MKRAALIAAFSLLMVAAGVAVASELSGEDSLLQQSWAKMQTASLYAKWKSQNKGEAAKLEAYWASGGTAPALATAFGQALVLEARAYWSLQSTTTIGTTTVTTPTTTGTTPTGTTPTPPPPTGYPDASNTGVPAGTTLTAYTGPSNITTANTTITGKTIGCIQVAAPGVTIRNSRISCGGGLAVFVDDRSSSATLLTIEDSEVSCQNTGGTGISEADFVVRRVEITGCENGFDLNQNVLIEDSFIHDLFNSADAHADGAQMSGSHWNGSSYECCALNVTLRHNTIFGMGAPNDSSFGTSAIIQNGANGNNFDTNVTIDNNLLAGGAATLYCRTTGSSVNERITNNKFSTRFGPHVGAFFPASGCSDETVVSGNVYQETGLPVPMG